MKFSDLNNLSLDNLGNWPMAAKGVFIAAVCIIVATAGYFIDTQNQLNELRVTENKEQELKQLLELKQSKASNLEGYQQQMKEIERTFGSLLRQLPSKTEVADLLTDISQTGLASGLEFQLFKPQAEVPVEFYAELPIKLRVKGRYHEFGKFVSGVASLPRIVTLDDFKIEPDQVNQSGELIMEATAKTYRYLDEKEQQQRGSE